MYMNEYAFCNFPNGITLGAECALLVEMLFGAQGIPLAGITFGADGAVLGEFYLVPKAPFPKRNPFLFIVGAEGARFFSFGAPKAPGIASKCIKMTPVSYTHLTLPTKA